jgi:hypothetical protein
MKTVEHHVTLCRIRLAQRILVAASDQDPELLTDHSWQKAMVHTGALLAKAELRNPARRIKVFAKIERHIKSPSDEETLQSLEKVAV